MTRTVVSRRRGIRLLVGLAASALVVTSVSGCAVVVAQSLSDALGGGSGGVSGSSGTSGGASTDPGGQPSQGPGSLVDVHGLSVGDCLNDGFIDSGDSSSAASTVPRISCGEPHDNEIYSVVQLTGTDYPGDDAANDQADTRCTAAFEDYTGATYDDAVGLDITWYLPGRSAWEGGDRLAECEVFGLDENGDPIQLTGSVQGRGDEFIATSQS